ncbi:MAG: PDZ domain-containing protein [Chloroflexi bacterium]|nr:PDZ domain-containing protein [Chloroflexota bacterium]
MATVLVRRLSRFVLAACLSLVLLASAALSPATYAQDASATVGLDGIGAEYHDMLDLFYRPVDPHDLLQAGWSALAADASRRGAAQPDPLPDLPADPDDALSAFSTAYSAYLSSTSLPASAAATDVETGMADSVHEQHTHFLSPGIMRAFLSTVSGGQSSTGLGIKLGGDPPGLITDVAPGGPADSGGLQPGDVIVSVDGKDVSHADAATLSSTLAGSADSSLQVTFDRGNGLQTTSVTRGPYYFPPLEASVLPGGIGYLKLSDFVISGTQLPDGTEILADLDQRLDDFDAQGAQGLILDLRNNGGGSVQTADEILGRFLPDNVRSVRESDQRGHLTFELAGGRTHARQLPMVVLINGGSASASEITASALRAAHRALLVGQRTAGAVASSELLPLPGGAGLQVAVAAAATADTNMTLDGVGITPDVSASQSRTLDDYRSGHDPQIDAAIGALASAPAPPAVSGPPPLITSDTLDQLLGGALLTGPDIPTNDRLTTTQQWQRLDYTHPNELIDQNGGAPDPIALQQTLEARGYQGSVVASYGGTPGDLPSVGINLDLYATADGAHAATVTNDLPQIQSVIDAPVQLGDETVAYQGEWLATGSTAVVWRRGRVVFTVTYSDVPGNERPDTLVAISQMVDSRARQMSVPYLP